MSSSEEMEDSPNHNDYSENVLQDQSEKFDRNPTRAVKENLPSVGELASENQRSPSSRSVKVSCQLPNQPPTSSSQAPNIDQLDETFSSTDVYSSRELRNHKNSSRSVDAVLSPRQNPTASSMSVLEDSNASGVKIDQRNLSSFAANLNADFSSPPERGPVPVIKSLSKNLKETNTPSPEKRSVETDVGATPIKRLRKTPESDLCKPETEAESYRSKLSYSAAVKTSHKSPTNLQIQQIKAEIQKTNESESLNTPSKPSKRKIMRNSSIESKTANDPCLSNLIFPSPAADTVHKSLTNLQMHGSKVSVRNVDESPTGRKTLIFFRDCSTDSNSLAKHSNPDDFLETASFLSLPTKEHESTALNEPTDASSDNPNLKNIKQKDTQSTSDISDEGALPNFTSKTVATIMHPTTLTDSSLFRPNNVSGKQRNRLPVSDVSVEVAQPDLPVKETEPAVHPLRLTDKNSSSNRGPASKSQNSTTGSFESCIEVKKIYDSASVSAKETQSTSNVADSAIETQILKSSQSSPIILNPHLPSSCYLPRRSNSSVTNVSHRILEYDTSDKKMRIDQNRSDSSTQTSTPDRESRSQSKELSLLRSSEMHRRSLLDKTLTSENSPQLYQSNKLQGMFPRAHPKESPTSCSLGMHRRSVSDETLTSRNLTEVQTQQDQSNSVIRSQSKETPISRSRPGTLEGVSRTTSVVQPLFRGMYPSSASNVTQATSNPLESSHSDRLNQLLLGATESLPSNESSTSRNNREVQMQRNRNDPLLQEQLARFLLGEASTSRNQPEVVSDITPPYIDVFEGQASTSSYQPIVTGGSSSFDQSYFPTPRNRPEMRGSEINSPCINVSARLASTFRYQPIRTGGPSSHDEDSTTDYLTSSSDVSEPGEARERTRGTFEPSVPSLPDEHAEYTVEARFLLLLVLREMMLLNGENDLWRSFEASFGLISESCSEVDSMKVCSKLTCYLADRGYGLWCQNLFKNHEMTAETCAQVIYEKLFSTVVSTLSFIFSVAITRDFNAVIHYYANFRNLYREFLLYSAINNVKDIQDEVSRNRVKTLKKIIQNLLLQTLRAFRLLLMYIGENFEEEFMEMYERIVSDEDEMYIRRNIR